MTRPILGAMALAAGLTALCVALPATAGPIERACMGSNRKAANPPLCRCIQRVADMTLQSGDQRRAAKFFRNPDEAQSVRMSKRGGDDAFWDRYKRFGETATAYCNG